MRTFQSVEVRPGTPYEMGFQYGEQAREKIVAGIEDYRRMFTSQRANWDRVKAYALTYVPVVTEFSPPLIEEAKGIAAGAGVDFGDVMVLNCRYEITKFPQAQECTSFSVLPAATRGGKTLVGQNWDYRAGIIDNIVTVHVETTDGTRIFGLAEAGQVIRNGFNTHGIGLCANNLQSIYDSRGLGVPATFLRRRVLSSKSFSEAKNTVIGAKRSVSCNLMLASAEGRAVDLEIHPKGTDLIDPVDGILTHANHFVVQPKIHALKRSPRGERLDALLRSRHGSIDVEHITRCLCDHQNYPQALCRHPDDPTEPLGMRTITVAGVVYDFADMTAFVCAGPPCEGEFIPHKL